MTTRQKVKPGTPGLTDAVSQRLKEQIDEAFKSLTPAQANLITISITDPPPSGGAKTAEMKKWKTRAGATGMEIKQIRGVMGAAAVIRKLLSESKSKEKETQVTTIYSSALNEIIKKEEAQAGSAPTREQEAAELAQLAGTVLEDRSLGVVGQGGSSAGTFFSTEQPEAAPFSSLQYAEPPSSLPISSLLAQALNTPLPPDGSEFGDSLESAFSAEPNQLKRVGKYAGAGSGGESITLPQPHYVQQQAVNKIDQAFQRLLTPSGQIEFIDYRNPITVRTGESKVLRDIDNPPVRSEFLDKALASYPIDIELALPENFFKLNNSYTNTAKLDTRAPWQKPGFVYEPAIGANWFGKADGPYKDSQWTQGDNPVQKIDLNVQPGGVKDYFPFNFSIG